MAEKTKAAEARSGVACTEEVRKLIRQLQAKITLKTGEKVTSSDAIASAVKAALAEK